MRLSLLVAGLLSLSAVGAAAPTTSTTTPAPTARAVLLADVDTGRVLAAHADHTPLPPASLSKMITAMIAADWLPPNATVPVSAAAATVYPDRVGMKAGQVWPLSITLHALLIASANDAAYAVAQRVSGSLAAFEKTMQAAAAQIGLQDHPALRDPAGLDGSEGIQGGNLISAWDLAVTARDMMANPALAAMAATKHFIFTGPDHVVYSLWSHNLGFLNSYPGAIGVKTGFTDRAGVCVVEEAQRQGRTMLAVVLNGSAPDQTAAALLNEGFSIPVKAEPQSDPLLPPISEPFPPPKPDPNPKPRINKYGGYNPGGPVSDASPLVAPRLAAAPAPSFASDHWMEAAAGAASFIVPATVLTAVRRRRRPAQLKLHSRRGRK